MGESSVRVPPGQELVVRDDLGDQIPKIEDGPWPAFPADLTSIALTVATQARGTMLIFEKMFESRLFFVDKLVAMGARIILCDPHRAVVTGPARLYGERLSSPDIRAGMAMLIAALCAEGIVDDRQRRRDRPRLRAHRRAAARARRADRARRRLTRRVSLAAVAAIEERGDGGRTGVRVAVFGSGEANVVTGLPVLDHLLTLLARHASFDLALEVAAGGSIREVVERRAARSAPGSRARCGCPARAGSRPRSSRPTRRSPTSRSRRPTGRSSSRTSTCRRRTWAGSPATSSSLFLRELAQGAGLTLHVRLLDGEDTQHVLEAIFKALGVALADACRPR